MPELPEVETVRQTLKKNIVGKTITGTRVYLNKIIKEPTLKEFEIQIKDQVIEDIERYGKYIYFKLTDFYLISHLRMEGKYFYQRKNEECPWKHVLIVFELDNGYELRYHDTRRFGTMNLQLKDKAKQQNPFLRIGPEPSSPKITVEYLSEAWAKKRLPIKSILLEQKTISGIGNIYADEILFESRISPFRPGCMLNKEEIALIITNSRKIMKQAIAMGGTTIASYTSSLGISGKFQNKLRIHTKKGLQCVNCNTTIQKDKINGRGTYFCTLCQNVK